MTIKRVDADWLLMTPLDLNDGWRTFLLHQSIIVFAAAYLTYLTYIKVFVHYYRPKE